MIDTKIIKSILANGGWCELNPKSSRPIKNRLNGRLIYDSDDYLVIERFNVTLESLDGFYIPIKQNIKKLDKSNWIKKYLTVGGRVIENTEIPNIFISLSWQELLAKLKDHKEVIKILFDSNSEIGIIESFNEQELEIRILGVFNSKRLINITASSIICLELRSKELSQVKKR